MVIGVTGRIATGKTTLAGILEKRGFIRIDADEVYHMLLKSSPELKSELTERFGGVESSTILKCISEDEKGLIDLNNITHKYVADEIKRMISDSSGKDIVLDVPVPIEKGFIDSSDHIIVTCCSAGTQLERIISRDGISIEQAELKISMQEGSEFYSNLGDTVISTEGMTEYELEKSLDSISALEM